MEVFADLRTLGRLVWRYFQGAIEPLLLLFGWQISEALHRIAQAILDLRIHFLEASGIFANFRLLTRLEGAKLAITAL